MDSIYSLIEVPEEAIKKPPRYKSKHDPNAPLASSTFDVQNAPHKKNGTFGHQPLKDTISTKQFLKKGTRPVPEVGQQKYSTYVRPLKELNKPPIPSRDDAPVIIGLNQSNQNPNNYVYANAVEAITMKPPATERPYKDFMKNEGYGKVPEYLEHVKHEVQVERELVQSMTRKQYEQQQPSLKAMDEEERQQLIRQLKMKWDALYKVYQKKSHCKVMEGSTLKLREAQERELDQIKADIFRLSQPGPIYIEDE